MKSHLQIVIPAYNEASRIGATLEDLFAQGAKCKIKVEVVVVLNGCRDNTREVVEKYRIQYPSQILIKEFKAPLGKGRAIIEGFKKCTAQYVSFMDADGSVSPTSVFSLLERIGAFDAAIGSRRCHGAKILIKQPFARHVAGRVYAWLTRTVLGLPFYDTQCGGKIFKNEVASLIADKCTEYGWAFDVAMLDLVLREGYTVIELPIVWANDDRSKVKLISDGFKMLKSLARLRFSNRVRRFQSVLMLQHHFINQGTYKRCFKFAEQLAHRKRHISIVCVDAQLKSYWPRKEILPQQPYVSLIKVPLFFGTNNPLSISLRVVFSALWFLTQRQYNLMHLFAVGHPFNAGLGLFIWLTAKAKHIAMDWDDLWGGGYGTYLGALMNSFLEMQERILPQMIRPVFMTTASSALKSRAVLNGMLENKTHVLVNGCDPQEIKVGAHLFARKNLGFESDKVYIISIGNTYSQKSFTYLLSAFRLALNEKNNLRLILLGDFSKFGALGQIIENIKFENSDLFSNSILTPGLVPLTQMQMYLEASDFAILPMEDTAIDHCRFPIRFGDYLAARKLIVSNAVGEIERIMREERIGLISAPNDLDGLAKNIVKAAQNADQRPELEKQMSSVQLKYSWKNLSTQLDSLYNLAMGNQQFEHRETTKAA